MAGDTRQHQEVTFKILVLGDASVGKTSLIQVFCDGALAKKHVPTIAMDCRDRVVIVDGWRIRLKLWDTAGQERFRTLTTAYYRGAHGIMLVYDISKAETFNNLDYWLQNLQMMAPGVLGKVIVGNKMDKTRDRAVTVERAQRLAEVRGVDFVETSTKTNENVDKAFELLTTSTLKGFLEDKIRKPKKELDHPKSLHIDSPRTKQKKKCAC